MVSRDAGIAERFPDNLAPMLLPDPDDVEDLIHRLVAWHSNRPCWKQQFEPLSAKLRGYSWADMAGRMVSLIETERTRLDAIVPKHHITDPQDWKHSASARSGHSIG
jgi:hypothetical protein